MNNWIYFVLISQGIWAFTSLIDKFVISKGHIKNPAVDIILNGLMNVLLIFLLPFIKVEMLSFANLAVVLLAGVLFSAAVAIYYKAVQYDEISRISILNQLSPVFVLMLSFIFLGEILTRNYFIGFLCLISAGMIISYNKKSKSLGLNKAFWLMLLSALLSAISLVIVKHIFSVTSFWNAFFWFRLSGFAALGVLIAPSVRKNFTKTFKAMNPKIMGLMTFKMIIDFSAFIFSGQAILNGPLSLVAALSNSVQPIFVFILALFTSVYLPKLVKEEIDKKTILTKVFALVLIMAGIVFVNI